MNIPGKTCFAFTFRGRVIWLDEEHFQVTVLNDLYRVHLIDEAPSIEGNCTDYVVEFFHKFSPNKLIYSPLVNDLAAEEFLLPHEKIKVFIKLTNLVNYSLKLALPPLIATEEEKVTLLASSLVDPLLLGEEEMAKHDAFIRNLVADKKKEIFRRYLSFIHKIKAARSISQVIDVSHQIVFEGLHVA